MILFKGKSDPKRLNIVQSKSRPDLKSPQFRGEITTTTNSFSLCLLSDHWITWELFRVSREVKRINTYQVPKCVFIMMGPLHTAHWNPYHKKTVGIVTLMTLQQNLLSLLGHFTRCHFPTSLAIMCDAVTKFYLLE